MKKFTERTIEKLIALDRPSKKIGIWIEGKFYTCWADQSKSRMGVRCNRLIKLNAKINVRAS